MAFNTGNPVPSTDGRDLSDNAEALDKIVNQEVTVTTRTGKIIKSIPQIVDPVDAAGTQGLIDIAADVDAVNAAADGFDAVAIDRLNDLDAAYVFTAINNGVWAEFETFTALNQYMVFTGTAYKPKNSTSLPYIVGATPVGDNNVEVVANLSTAQGDVRYDKKLTLAQATLDLGALVEMTIRITDRADGLFDWVSGETPNGRNIITHDTLPLQLKLRDNSELNALEWGAKADSGVTNNTPIFQDMHDLSTAISTTGFVPDAPEGEYYGVEGTTNVSRDNFHFKAESTGAVIRTSSPTLSIFELKGLSPHPADLRNAKVTGFTFQGTGAGSTARAVNMQRCHECEVSGNRFGGDVHKIGYGVYLDGGFEADADNNIITRNQVVRVAVTGIILVGGAACEENAVTNNVLTGCGVNGISCSGDKNTITGNTLEESQAVNIVVTGDANTVTGNTASQAISHGINVGGTLNTVTGNVANSNGGNGINLSAGGQRNAIVGNTCLVNTGFGISNPAATSQIIVGNTLSDNSGGSRQIDRGTTNAIFAHNFDSAEKIPHHIVEERLSVMLTVNGSATNGVSSSSFTWAMPTDLTVPVNGTAVILEVRMQDSGAGAADANIRFFPTNNLVSGAESIIRAMPANDRWNSREMIVPFAPPGNVTITISATGAGTMDYELRLVGWVLE